MSHCHASLLSDRAAVSLGGGDVRKFLQGLITNDVGKAQGGDAIHAGLLSPQGKILFDFFVVPVGDGFLLEVARSRAGDLIQRLGFYRLRAQVELAEAPSLSVAAIWGGLPGLPDGAIVYADPRLPALGFRAILPAGLDLKALGCAPEEAEAYHAQRIALGVPEGGRDYAFGDTFPHEALFDQLNGVDFKKGCYVGQEVVARMEHRGTARKRIVPVMGDGPLPASGTPVEVDAVPIGMVGSVSGRSGLAMIRLDRAETALAGGKALTAGGVKLVLLRPAFARFSVPGTGVAA